MKSFLLCVITSRYDRDLCLMQKIFETQPRRPRHSSADDSVTSDNNTLKEGTRSIMRSLPQKFSHTILLCLSMPI